MNSLVVLFAVVCAACAAPHVEKRSLGHAVAYSFPAAVSHQSRVDVSSPAVVETAVYGAPVVPAATVYAAHAPAAVSYQSPAVVSASVVAPSVYAPAATAYVGGSAVTHQSRVDVKTSPAVVAEHVVAPAVVNARSVWAPSAYVSYL